MPQPPFPLIPLYTDAVRRSLRCASGGSVYTSADWVGAPRVGALRVGALDLSLRERRDAGNQKPQPFGAR